MSELQRSGLGVVQRLLIVVDRQALSCNSLWITALNQMIYYAPTFVWRSIKMMGGFCLSVCPSVCLSPVSIRLEKGKA